MKSWLVVVSVVGVACTGNSGSMDAVKEGAPVVKATSYPVYYAAKRIGAPRMAPEILLPDGEDAATWQPSGEVVASLDEADLILVNGAGFESWVKTATLPTAKVVDGSAGIETVEIDGPTHSHGGDEHSHAGVDPHVWADPSRFLQQAKNVHAALVKADPEGAQIYDAQLGAVERNTNDLIAELDPVLAQLEDRPKVANHPSFTYLAARGGFEIPTFDLDPSTPPTPEQVTALTEAYPRAGTLLLWEAPPSKEVAAALPTFEHVVLDPLEAPKGGSYDYFGQARLNVKLLERALAKPLPPEDTDAPSDTDASDTDAADAGTVDTDTTTP